MTPVLFRSRSPPRLHVAVVKMGGRGSWGGGGGARERAGREKDRGGRERAGREKDREGEGGRERERAGRGERARETEMGEERLRGRRERVLRETFERGARGWGGEGLRGVR